MRYAVLDLAQWTRGEREPGGDEEKRWFTAPADGRHQGSWLFKPRREKALLLSRERQQRGDAPEQLVRGEDWAEKIAYELACAIAVPAAVTELATTVRRRDGQTVVGSMSRDIRPQHWQLSPGATLLDEYDDHFDARTCRGHDLEAIKSVLAGVTGPPATRYEDWPAFDVFTGYLLLDAWIANTDRHPHNWGVLQTPSGSLALAPSFDHGSALASGDGEARRARKLSGGVESWCLRGWASRFEVDRGLTLVELASEAVGLASPAARRHWMSQMSQVEAVTWENVVAGIPNLSESTRNFVSEVLTINRRRLRDVT